PLFLYTENPPSRPYTLSLHDALPIWFISHHTRPGVLGSAARHQPTHANILIGQKSPHLDWTRCGHRIRRGIWLFCIRQVAFRFLQFIALVRQLSVQFSLLSLQLLPLGTRTAQFG